MNLQPVERRSVSDAVFAQLQAEILSGHLVPGEAMPSERALTDLTGVNRQAVREALKRLDQAGLIEINHGGATRVRDYRLHAGLDLLPELLARPDGSVDVAVARSILEMRACIGPDAARLCALRAVSPLPDQLGKIVDAMDAVPDDLAALAALDWRFWELIIEGSDNVAYRLAFNSLRAGAAPVGDALHLITGDELRDRDGHRDLATAVSDAAPAAAEAAARRLLQRGIEAAAAVFTSVAERPEPPDQIKPADQSDTAKPATGPRRRDAR